MRQYWNKHVGFIHTPLVKILEDGFVYEGKQYKWSDIARIEKRNRSITLMLLLYPLGHENSIVHLEDGKKIRINSKATAIKGHPELLNSDVYRELMDTMEAKYEQSYNNAMESDAHRQR